jgi:predicted HTH domain antitoxin
VVPMCAAIDRSMLLIEWLRFSRSGTIRRLAGILGGVGSPFGTSGCVAEVTVPLFISDETLQAAGLTEGDALVEFACRLFDAGRLPLWPAAKLAGLSRVAFEQALRERKIAEYRPKPSDLADDLRALDRLGI